MKDRKSTYMFDIDLLSLLWSHWKILGSLIYSAPKWEIIHATATFLADLGDVRHSTSQQFALTASHVTRMILWEDWQTIYGIMDASFGVFSCPQCVMATEDIWGIKYILPHISFLPLPFRSASGNIIHPIIRMPGAYIIIGINNK